jgi:hypothetical protein
MTPIKFPNANSTFGPPGDMTKEQVEIVPAYMGVVRGGNCDGAPVTVTAWQPDAEDIRRIVAGQPIYFSVMLNGLPPHMISTEFAAAAHPGSVYVQLNCPRCERPHYQLKDGPNPELVLCPNCGGTYTLGREAAGA